MDSVSEPADYRAGDEADEPIALVESAESDVTGSFCVDVLASPKRSNIKEGAILLSLATQRKTSSEWERLLKRPPFRIEVGWSEEQCDKLVRKLSRHGVIAETIECDTLPPAREKKSVSMVSILALILIYFALTLVVAMMKPELVPEGLRDYIPGYEPSPVAEPEPEPPPIPVTPAATMKPATERGASVGKSLTPAGMAATAQPVPKEESQLYMETRQALLRSDFETAQSMALQLLTMNPGNTDYQSLMEEIVDRIAMDTYRERIRDGELPEAIAGLRGLIQRHPDWVRAKKLLGLTLVKAARYSEAFDVLVEFDTADLEDPEILEAMSTVWRNMGNPERAVQYAERARVIRRERP